jgi:hypothetical protein
VREKAILDRERGVGLGLAPYLAAKFFFFGTLTMLQVIVLWLILSLEWYPDVGTYPAGGGFLPRLAGGFWQAVGATGIALCATAWGLAVSAWARRADQASFMVPLLVIPQILFSGFVFPLDKWQNRETDTVRPTAGKMIVRQTAKLIPGYSGQRLMETSLAWDQDEDDRSDAARERAFENLKILIDDEDWKSFVNGAEQGVTWRFFGPATGSVVSLTIWTALSLGLAALGLKKERR